MNRFDRKKGAAYCLFSQHGCIYFSSVMYQDYLLMSSAGLISHSNLHVSFLSTFVYWLLLDLTVFSFVYVSLMFHFAWFFIGLFLGSLISFRSH